MLKCKLWYLALSLKEATLKLGGISTLVWGVVSGIRRCSMHGGLLPLPLYIQCSVPRCLQPLMIVPCSVL